jgi:hypothetical protein
MQGTSRPGGPGITSTPLELAAGGTLLTCSVVLQGHCGEREAVTEKLRQKHEDQGPPGFWSS